jgi:hypothetical protein
MVLVLTKNRPKAIQVLLISKGRLLTTSGHGHRMINVAQFGQNRRSPQWAKPTFKALCTQYWAGCVTL